MSVPAPVKAPFTWPNSSLSISPSGIAPQFTGTKGSWARGLFACTARATSSLPTPLSPVISTVVRAAATFSTNSKTDCMAGLRPTI